MGRHISALAVVTLLAAAGCSTPARPPEPWAATPVATTVTGTTAPTSEPVPFTLSTHCGIDEAKFQNRYYEAVRPIPDPLPKGWDNPAQRGTMRAVSATEAEFRDAAGHVVLFRVRPQATSYKRLCA
jgi:hypothetical protein